VTSWLRALVVVAAVTLAGTTLPGLVGDEESTRSGATPAVRPTSKPTEQAEPEHERKIEKKPLAGTTVALDPGHQLGNAHFPDQVNSPVDAGGLQKPCNSTGTATDDGVAEATVVWELAREVQRRLQRLGAEVRLTRNANTQQMWGPCVDERGRFAAKVGADVLVSLHADGNTSGGTGFHVIAPSPQHPRTKRIAGPSRRLAEQLRDGLVAAGLPRSSYVGEGTGLDVRDDLGTLNLSSVPAVMVEIGNMREPEEAARMTSPAGRAAYANGIVRGISHHLGN
jgi:N-acetylmuramoyl-L-alanine amidase